MEVTHVLRGEDHLANTPRQILLLKALSLTVPQYGHLALIVGEGGAPLSKREGGGSLRELRDDGILPEALLNYLVRLGHTYASNDFMPFADLAVHFQLAHIGHSPAHFDHQQLEHWQRTAMRGLSAARLWQWLTQMRPELNALVPSERRAAFLELVQENLSRPTEALMWARIVFADQFELDATALAVIRATGHGFFEQALAGFKRAPADFRLFAKAVGVETRLSGKNLFAPLRAALTGQTHGPEMDRLWRLMFTDLIEQRLRAALDCCKP
jgi:glutamyl-tRNA synthetase